MLGVSVLMPAYNAERYIAEAVESILRQSEPPDEIIVIDDGSTDGTRGVLEGFADKISVLSQENRGQTEALNRAIKIARGKFLAFQDADDIWAERKLEWQLSALRSDSELGAVFGMIRQFISPEVPLERRAAIQPTEEIALGEMRVCMLIRRSEFDRIGDFDPSYRGVSFIEWLGRAKRMGLKIHALDQVIAHRRLHLNNYGRLNTETRDEETMLALRKVVLQRRQKRDH